MWYDRVDTGMSCPVCDGTDATMVNVRMSQDSDLAALAGSTWDGKNVARCDGCGVIYDPEVAGDDGDPVVQEFDEVASGRVNCPDCGALNEPTADECATCDVSLT